MVFHSWRGTYATLLDSLGASPKETQELMRHATPVMTMQRYVQARHDRQKALVQTMAEVVISAQLVPEPPVRGEGNDDNFSVLNLLCEDKGSGECGIRTRDLRLARAALSQTELIPHKQRRTGRRTRRMGLGRVELPTSRLSGVRSHQLSYRPRIRAVLAAEQGRQSSKS